VTESITETDSQTDSSTRLTDCFFQDNLGKPATEGKTILYFNEARDDGVEVASAGPYANHLHLTPDR